MISIVTAYYNRRKIFIETLKSIYKSSYINFEIIAVDDASCAEERIEDLMEVFPELKVIRVEEKDKWYKNSCIPYNIGIKNAIGDIILLQNPECLHVHDVLSYMVENVNDSNYITASTYSVDKRVTDNIIPHLSRLGIRNLFSTLPQQKATNDIGWYNHSVYKPTYYHFCAGITRKNIEKLKGFDERYAPGIGYEDDEFVYRIGKLGLTKIIANKVSVIHQRHQRVYNLSNPIYKRLYDMNKVLFQQLCKS
jgi:GT2 family glycosyltransferase